MTLARSLFANIGLVATHRTSYPLYTRWLLENTEARSMLPWEIDGCWVCFVHAGKIRFDVTTLAFPSSYRSAVAGCFLPDLGIQ